MAAKRNASPFQSHDGGGLDAPYNDKDERARAERELADTMAGPKLEDIAIATDDTEMKNPDNEFTVPGSAASLKRKRKPRQKAVKRKDSP